MSEMKNFIPMKNSGYKRFIAGQIVSILGSEIVGFVMAVYLTRKYESPLYMAIVMILQYLPRVIIGPIAGVWADKRNRKKIIIISDLLQAIVTSSLVLLFTFNTNYSFSFWETGEIFIIFSFLLLRSVLQAIQGPSVSSTLPTIVPGDKLSQINGIFQFANGVMGLIAPILAAILISLFNLPEFTEYNLMWIDAITFLIALTFVITVKIPEHPKVEDQAPSSVERSRFEKFVSDFKEGITILKIIPGLSGLLATFVLANFMIAPMNTLSDIILLVIHEGTNLEYVFSSLFFGLGLIVGSIITTVVKNWKNMTSTMFLCIIMVFSGLFIFGITPNYEILPGSLLGIRTSFWIIAFSGFITTFGIPIMSTIAVTMIQLSVPLDKMGRFSGFMNVLISTFTPIGYLISGFLGEFLNVHWVVGVTSILAIGIFLIMRSNSKIDKLEPIVKEKLAMVKQQAKMQQQQTESSQKTDVKLE